VAEPQPSRTLAAEVAELGPWFHNLHLPGDVQTAPGHPLGDFPANKWKRIAPVIPADLTGWRVLDVGCNAGFYSIELARRGARVTGIDHDPHYLRQAAWARDRLGLHDVIELRLQPIYEVARQDERYDLVWFMGVLYHLRHPLLALDILARCTRRLMMFQTMTMPDDASIAVRPDYPLDERAVLAEPGWPKMAFIEHALAGDHTNWWAANPSCVEAMLRSSGFRVLERPGHELYLCGVDEQSPARIASESELRAVLGQATLRSPSTARK
jgi:tRNA (mo5U34)-methyltransferase